MQTITAAHSNTHIQECVSKSSSERHAEASHSTDQGRQTHVRTRTHTHPPPSPPFATLKSKKKKKKNSLKGFKFDKWREPFEGL